MVTPLIPDNESVRLTELNRYNILDTLSEKDYDDITLMAATICRTPISLITFIDKERQWFKSHKGLASKETKREYAFCAHALNKPGEILIVPDSRKDKRFEDNPLVTGDPHVIFYTGVPLLTPHGYPLGTLCVIDNKLRHLSDEQLTALQILSKQVIALLEMRKANLTLQSLQVELETRNKELEQFASVVSHDIKSPLTGIFLATQILNTDNSIALGEEGIKFLDIIKSSAQKINDLVDGILSYYRDGDSKHPEKINLTELFESIIPFVSDKKKIEINYSKSNQTVFMNKTHLEQIFSNLINNSLKYSDKEIIKIDISFSEDKQYYHFSIKDNGAGIAKDDQQRIFTLFTKLPRENLTGKNSYGIGLATVRKIVEKNNGTISVNSTVGTGTTFSFNIQKLIE